MKAWTETDEDRKERIADMKKDMLEAAHEHRGREEEGLQHHMTELREQIASVLDLPIVNDSRIPDWMIVEAAGNLAYLVEVSIEQIGLMEAKIADLLSKRELAVLDHMDGLEK